MRIRLAKLLVVVTGLLIVGLAILFAVIQNPSNDSMPRVRGEVRMAAPAIEAAPSGDQTRAQPPAAVARGRAVYVEQRCSMCHSLEGEGNTILPLDDVSRRLTEREIRLWIVSPQEMDPTVSKRGFRLPAEDLDALVAYLASKRPL